MTAVIRRSFRIGLALGLLAGLAFALAKMLGGRHQHQGEVVPVPSEPWPRLTEPPAPRATPLAEPVPVEPAAAPAAPEAPAEVAPAEEPPAAEPPADEAARVEPSAPVKPAQPAKRAPAKKAATRRAAPRAKAPQVAWVEPNGDVCPTTHPVKAKLSSKIFHLPGMLNYERTKPDRCYRDPASAESDGLRPAKR